MQDSQYCYPASEVLINKLNIKYEKDLFNAEKELTAIRLRELQEKPIKGKYDFAHLKAIHKYIFQDIYSWAGKVRTVEIGKGIFSAPLHALTIMHSRFLTNIFHNALKHGNHLMIL